MATRTKILEDLVTGQADPISGDIPHRIVAIEFHKGGMSLWTYENETRGYFLTVRDEKYGTSAGGFTVRSFMLFTGGIKRLLEPAKAFSAKKLATLTAPPEMIAALKAALDRSNAETEARHAARAR